MKKVLITGIAGLLGSHFSRYLLDNGYDVIGIDDLSGGYEDFLDPRITEFYAMDLGDAEALQEIFQKTKPDYVYHFAAYAAEGLSPFIRNFNYTNNLLSSVNIINNCITHDVKKLIFTSSMAVYGVGNPPFTEDQLPSPEDPYGIAKYAVEMDIKLASEQFGLNYTIIRPHNVIGIYQNIWDKYRNVIGIWIRRALVGEPLLIYGDGTQKRAFSDIQYYMEPFKKLMEESSTDKEVFNIGADHEYEIGQAAALVQKVAQEFGYNPTIEHVEARHEVKDAYCNHDKAKKYLGFEDKTDMESMIRTMFAWAKEQPMREVKKMEYEVDKNIYSFWK
jgi:UDP-glucose 4-epimerase